MERSERYDLIRLSSRRRPGHRGRGSRPIRRTTTPASSGNDAVTEKLRIELGQHHRSLGAMTIPRALDWAAVTWSAKVALSFVHGPDLLTYRQLAESVARLRTGLVLLGLRPADRVGVMIPNQVEFPLAWLSVIDAGAVAVPLNPTYTRREIEFVLGDTGANWLITTSELLSKHETATFAPVRRPPRDAARTAPPRGRPPGPCRHPVHLRQHRPAQGLHAHARVLARDGNLLGGAVLRPTAPARRPSLLLHAEPGLLHDGASLGRATARHARTEQKQVHVLVD